VFLVARSLGTANARFRNLPFSYGYPLPLDLLES
jgi:hypothetical protein